MVQLSITVLTAFAGALAHVVLAAPSSTVPVKRAANCNFPNPSSSSNVVLSTPSRIPAGTTKNGGGLRYGRGVKCGGQKEGGDKDAVFLLESGATLENAVIGADQNEGIHCLGSCTLRNVWFEDVCEDAITIKQSSGTSTIVGGGAKGADDKVIQHNGGGLVKIESYCVQDFGKLYRSCGNCSSQTKRQVEIKDVIARNGKLLAGVNSNFGDVATINTGSNSYTSLTSVCDTFEGNNSGAEPKTLTKNQPNANCKF
ncbi:putative effector protein [Ceratobasidium theobromae]|uniref:Pectate lyase n=1 Tax=Ceratobasidium theobromae TaxID=1582974 RepID=A0A5N5QDK4_9AGAM|nr:putative effector protein [Ceratobasidium theobromae]